MSGRVNVSDLKETAQETGWEQDKTVWRPVVTGADYLEALQSEEKWAWEEIWNSNKSPCYTVSPPVSMKDENSLSFEKAEKNKHSND